jgi:hypothetical protein
LGEDEQVLFMDKVPPINIPYLPRNQKQIKRLDIVRSLFDPSKHISQKEAFAVLDPQVFDKEGNLNKSLLTLNYEKIIEYAAQHCPDKLDRIQSFYKRYEFNTRKKPLLLKTDPTFEEQTNNATIQEEKALFKDSKHLDENKNFTPTG